MMKRDKGNIVGSIFISYGELHDNCQFLKTINLEEQQNYFNKKYIGDDDFPHLLQSKGECEIRT